MNFWEKKLSKGFYKLSSKIKIILIVCDCKFFLSRKRLFRLPA